ncbi:MAG: hypothetical protein ABSF99_03375 [Anaerolineales bacterium]|jgi:hypothetical protein
MKRNMRLLVVMGLTIMLLTALFPVKVLAKENKTYFTGTECFGAITDNGTVTTFDNGKMLITGMKSWHTDTTSDPRLSGTDYVVINGVVVDPVAGNGFFNGTFNIVNAGGSWKGLWTGKMENGSFTIDGLLHGSGGYNKLAANWHYSPVADANGCNLTSGYIVETGGH